MQPGDFEFSFEYDNYPMSFDEVIAGRALILAFDYTPRDEDDMISEGIHMAVFAKDDEEIEEISHLVEKKETQDFVDACYQYLETTE